jgi:hypothetical protein
MDRLLAYGGIAAVLNLLVTWLAVSWRTDPRERLAAAIGVVLIGLLVALGPAGLAWIAVSPPFAWSGTVCPSCSSPPSQTTTCGRRRPSWPPRC